MQDYSHEVFVIYVNHLDYFIDTAMAIIIDSQVVFHDYYYNLIRLSLIIYRKCC